MVQPVPVRAARSYPNRMNWQVVISEWIPDPDDSTDPDGRSASGEPIVECQLPGRPSAQDIATLIDLCSADSQRLAAWAATPIGQPLEGATVIATARPHAR